MPSESITGSLATDMPIGKIAVKCGDAPAANFRKGPEIGVRPQIAPVERSQGNMPPMRFHKRVGVVRKEDAPIALELVVNFPGLGLLKNVGTQDPGVCKKAQKTHLGHTTECQRIVIRRFKPPTRRRMKFMTING